MHLMNVSGILIENSTIHSSFLGRKVIVDFYLPKNVADPAQMSLLLMNDGQNMKELGFDEILQELYSNNSISPLLCVAIHAGTERKMEYGTAHTADYKGRGAKAAAYQSFLFWELIPYIQQTYFLGQFREKAFAGFSLGGLSALDIVWNHPEEFKKVGVFSGSLWWRKKGLKDNYSDELDRIMHLQIRNDSFKPGVKFFFQTGTLDEKMDRNNNGVIDSIDDTLDLISELKKKGYTENDIHYMEIPGGKHDIATWKLAMPEFLKWGWKGGLESMVGSR